MGEKIGYTKRDHLEFSIKLNLQTEWKKNIT